MRAQCCYALPFCAAVLTAALAGARPVWQHRCCAPCVATSVRPVCQTNKQTSKQSSKQTSKQANKNTSDQINHHTIRGSKKQTDIQTSKQTCVFQINNAMKIRTCGEILARGTPYYVRIMCGLCADYVRILVLNGRS